MKKKKAEVKENDGKLFLRPVWELFTHAGF